jgi:RNA polymerase sigma factor (TIGR02999 family)
MSHPAPGTITRLLNQAGQGDVGARDELYRLVYDELLDLARRRLAREDRLRGRKQAESLVADIFLKFERNRKADWNNRDQFYGYVRRAMWQVCVDQIRKDRARAGQMPYSEWMAELRQDPIESVALADALDKLAKLSHRQVEVVLMRFIEGRSVKETAQLLGVGDRTVESDWAVARAWLHRELKGGSTSLTGPSREGGCG